jgi:hypothetical protein
MGTHGEYGLGISFDNKRGGLALQASTKRRACRAVRMSDKLPLSDIAQRHPRSR